MESPPKAEDKLNIIGIVVIGLCGAVLVYVSVIALQAFYLNETSAIEAQRAAAGRAAEFKALRADHVTAINEYAEVDRPEGVEEDLYAIPVEVAMTLVVDEAQRQANQTNLIPAVGPSTVPTYAPFGGELETPEEDGDGEDDETTDGEEAAPEDGEEPAPADGEQAAPADGAEAAPADGGETAPAEGGGAAAPPDEAAAPGGNEPTP